MKPEQITAWALNEASAEEREQLEAALLENPQDKQKADETKAFCDFLLSELRDESLALTDKQRERLVEQASAGQSSRLSGASGAPVLHPESGAPALRPPRKGETRWNMVAIVRLGIAACAVLGGFWTWQSYSRRAVQVPPTVAEKAGIKVQLAQKPEMKKKTKEEARLLAAAPKPVIVPQAPTAKPLSRPEAAPPAAEVPSIVALNQDQRAMTPADVERLKRVQDEKAYGLSFGGAQTAGLSSVAEVMPIQGGAVSATGSLAVTATGVTTRRVEPQVMGISTLMRNDSSEGAGAGSSGVQLSSGGGVVELRGTANAKNELGSSSTTSLTMTPGAAALLRQTQARPAASLSLKVGFYPPQMSSNESSPNDMVIDGNINLHTSRIGGYLFGPVRMRRHLPSQYTVLSLLNQDVLEIDWGGGWLPMPPANPAVLAASVEPDVAGTLADYQPSVAFGDVGLYNSGTAAVVLRAAKGSFGSIVVQSVDPRSLHAPVLLNAASAVTTAYFKGIGNAFDLPMVGWTRMHPYDMPNSPGLIFFASGTMPSANPAVSLNVSGGSEMQAAVFNNSALPDAQVVSDSGAAFRPMYDEQRKSGAFGSGAVVLAGGTLADKPAVDLAGSMAVTTKSGTRASMVVTREFDYSGARFDGRLEAPVTTFANVGTNTISSGNLVLGAPVSERNMGRLEANGRADYASYTTLAAGTTLTVNGKAGLDELQKTSDPAAPAGAAGNASVNSLTFATANVSDAGGMTKTGAGALTLAGANSYTGATVLSGGTLSVSGGRVVQAGGSSATGAANQMTGAGRVTFNGGVTVTAAPAVPASTPAAFNSNTAAPVPLVMNPEPAAKVQAGLELAAATSELGNYDTAIAQYQDVLRTDPHNAAARRGMEDAEKKRQEYFKTAYDHQRAKMLAQVTESWEEKVPMLAATGDVSLGKDVKTDAFYFGTNGVPEESRPAKPSQPSTGESYTRIIENEMKEVAREPLSTLSIDVDTASYANVRRFLNQNMLPPPDAVRIEELVNYFPTAEEGPAHGAKEPFAVRVELAPCPWQPVHRLARISIKGREMDKDRKASNLVFLVDVSGSMNEPQKLPLVQQSLRMLTEQLGEGDRVTMVVYAGSSGVVLPPTSGEKKAEILAAINRLQAGGSTHGSAGIQLAYEQAVAGFIKGGVNRVILCTDGDFNVGVSSPEELEKLIKHKAKTGVFLSVLGFGSGNLKDRTMETLADKGNGNYAYIDSLSEARKVLVEQMSGTLDTIAKDVKIQVEFNPAAVRSYRLIGYENRVMAKEDFNDDTKDAGEIGAGHSVVALYEVVPANLPAGAEPRPAVDSLKYQAPAIPPAQLAEAAKNGEVMTVKLRYKEPDSDLSKLVETPVKDEGKTLTASTEEFKFSAAVAGFGLLLRDSSYKGTLGWETVRRLALDGKGADKLGYRGEFLQLIDKARGLKSEK